VAQRILLVGGTGFVGAPLARQLAATGHDVTVFHRGRLTPALPAAVTHVVDPDAPFPLVRFPDALRHASFDAVVHMIAFGEADAAAAVDAFRGRAGRLVIASSGDVYAAYGVLIGLEPPRDLPARCDEDAPLRSVLYPYGRVTPSPWGELRDYEKILAERAAAAADLPATIVRLPKVYGPGDRAATFGELIGPMRAGADRIVLGEAEAAWRWTHGYVDDVAAALAVAATHPAAAGRVYNAGEAETPTVRERAEALAGVLGWTGSIATVPGDELPPPRALGRPRPDLVCPSDRLRAELGLADDTPRQSALARTAAAAAPQ